MDERQKNNMDSAMAKVLIMVYIAVVVFGVFSFLQNFDIMDCIFALVIAIAAPILVLLFSRNKRKKATFPMTLAGIAIFPDRTRKAKVGRIKAYVLDSLRFAAIFTVLQALFDLCEKYQAETLLFSDLDVILNYVMGFILEFLLFFAAYFITDYVMYEYKSKRYCKEHEGDKQ